jgi:hypothetical protein
LTLLMAPVAVVIAIFCERVFKRAHFKFKTSSYFYMGLLASYVVVPSFVGAIFINQYLMDAGSARGKKILSARNLPIAAVVQICEPIAQDIACAITLWPVQYQDAELIGTWIQETPSRIGMPLMVWRPFSDKSTHFPLIAVEAHREVTIELKVPREQVCVHGKTNMSTIENFFQTTGRIKGVQQLNNQKLRIRVDNVSPTFSELIDSACNISI